MIVTRTPFRITLGGGGTDLPSFYQEYGGFVLAVAINKYMFLSVNTPILDDFVRVRYSRAEQVEHVDQVEHPLARMAIKHFGIENGIEVVSIADIPAGTGLGSSSCYLVGLLNALHALTQMPASPQEIAEEACHIELNLLKKPIGKTRPIHGRVRRADGTGHCQDGKSMSTMFRFPSTSSRNSKTIFSFSTQARPGMLPPF